MFYVGNYFQVLIFDLLENQDDINSVLSIGSNIFSRKPILADIIECRGVAQQIVDAESRKDFSPQNAIPLLLEVLQGDFSDLLKVARSESFSGLSGEKLRQAACEATQKIREILQYDVFQKECRDAYSDFFSHNKAIAA